YHYLKTAIDQLAAGLLLEENPVVVSSTASALELLIRCDPNSAALRLHEVNVKLQNDLASSLAEYFVELGHKVVPPTALDNYAHSSLWEQVGSLTGYYHATIRDFVQR